AAGAEVERVARGLAPCDPLQHLEAAGRGAVMAGAEGEPRLDLDGDVADAPPCPIMAAVDEEAADADRLQAGQRVRHPVDVGQDLAFERPAAAFAFQDAADRKSTRLNSSHVKISYA